MSRISNSYIFLLVCVDHVVCIDIYILGMGYLGVQTIAQFLCICVRVGVCVWCVCSENPLFWSGISVQICVTPSGYHCDVCQKVGGFYVPANNIKPPYQQQQKLLLLLLPLFSITTRRCGDDWWALVETNPGKNISQRTTLPLHSVDTSSEKNPVHGRRKYTSRQQKK